MVQKDIRWIQRFRHFEKALSQLSEAVTLSKTRSLTNLEKQGLIQAFEFTHELAWNLLKDYIEYNGGQVLIGWRDTTREAFQKNLVSRGDVWMEMIKSRNLTSHTYNEDTAKQIVDNVTTLYIDCFVVLREEMKKRIS